MELKEMGAYGVFVVGGAVFGISQFGLGDVLSEDLRHITAVSAQERPAYMESVVAEFTDAFATYSVQTETYSFLGYSEFSTAPANGIFVEVVRQETPVPGKEVNGLNAFMKSSNFCDQDEMTMFTDKGWTYRFSMVDSKGRKIFAVACAPETAAPRPQLRGSS